MSGCIPAGNQICNCHCHQKYYIGNLCCPCKWKIDVFPIVEMPVCKHFIPKKYKCPGCDGTEMKELHDKIEELKETIKALRQLINAQSLLFKANSLIL